ncbi:hypothetical protein [Halomonas caseinilytica]|uniref:hypothetical protein n=1 Tax=Halomonas caseinilytica TaxID=438744 RepID=UPI0007E57088|nr:hypothetical protein [Halomonas caseinilytica]SEM31931.1 hypothetical protein SAMN04487952_1034 [Halomonas caseinilytica]
MKKTLLLAALLLVATPQAFAAEWYENGTLHNESALEWQDASHANKLATAGDLLAAAYQQGSLKPEIANKINGVADIRPLAETLVSQLDDMFKPEADEAANRKMFANQKVNESAAMLLIMMGWADMS